MKFNGFFAFAINCFLFNQAASAAEEWRPVCQPSCASYSCKVNGRDILRIEKKKITIETAKVGADIVGERQPLPVVRVEVGGTIIHYAMEEVSNCVYLVWSNSPLF